MSMPNSFNIKLEDKPNLFRLMQENPAKAREVIGTFVGLIDEAVAKGWHELPGKFHKDLTLRDLVRGILRGSLDLKDIDPEAYDVLFEEVHPLSKLSTRPNKLGGNRYATWREHFRMPKDADVNEEAVSDLFRKMLRYSKYVNMEELFKALDSNQIAIHRGMGHLQVQMLPFMPALRYQRSIKDDLQVGKMLDSIGAIDCGEILPDTDDCPACQHPGLHPVGEYRICLSCNAGFIAKDF